jgi:hypothetical protein
VIFQNRYNAPVQPFDRWRGKPPTVSVSEQPDQPLPEFVSDKDDDGLCPWAVFIASVQRSAHEVDAVTFADL